MALSDRIVFVLTLAVLGLGSVAPAHAQEAFATLDVRAAGTVNFNHSFVHEFWEQGVGGEVAVATPFYAGYAELGGALHLYRAATPSVPAFEAWSLFAGWGVGLEAGRLRFEGGPRVGNYHMRFAAEDAFPGVRNESELALGAAGRIALRPVGPVSVFVAGSYTRVFTFNRLKLWYASAGISYRFASPTWLKEFVK